MKAYNYHTLTTFLFSQIINENDVTYLCKGNKDKLTEEEKEELEVLWTKIFYIFLEDKGDKEVLNNFRTIKDMLEMEKEYETIRSCIMLFSLASEEDRGRVVNILKNYNQELDLDKKLKPQFDKITRYLKILKTNIQQERLDNAELFKRATKKVKLDIYRETATINRVLGVNLNPMKTTLPEHVAHLKILEQHGRRSTGTHS